MPTLMPALAMTTSGRPALGDAFAAGRGDGGDVADVGAVDRAARRLDACARRPARDLVGAARDQRQAIAGAMKAGRQRLADPARRAGDEDQRLAHRAATFFGGTKVALV